MEFGALRNRTKHRRWSARTSRVLGPGEAQPDGRGEHDSTCVATADTGHGTERGGPRGQSALGARQDEASPGTAPVASRRSASACRSAVTGVRECRSLKSAERIGDTVTTPVSHHNMSALIITLGRLAERGAAVQVDDKPARFVAVSLQRGLLARSGG